VYFHLSFYLLLFTFYHLTEIPMKQFNYLLFLGFLFLLNACTTEDRPLALKQGMVISESVRIEPGEYAMDASEELNQPLLTIRGDDVTVDFQGAILKGSNDKRWPDEFYGLAIRVADGTNITIKNLNVHGYKVGLLAENADSLTLINSDFSYNYRQRLKSTREEEDLADWMSYHNNEEDEWLRYGAAVYLKYCNNATVKNIRVTGGQNGIMMTHCNDGLFYNNTLHFNSAIGIGMYRSSRNRFMHNRLDWNVRGYSHGFYSRGQDSAGILCYEKSNDNIFAYNSATHSGDGFFLWGGQSFIETGVGGCNNNIVYQNDFSYAVANAVEATFSKNQVIGNVLNESTYGIWGGYSYGSTFANNQIRNNTYGIAIEHGHENDIFSNHFVGNEVGIRLWERPEQPADFAFAQNRDVSSRTYQIEGNTFERTEHPLQISHTNNIRIENNHFSSFRKLLASEDANFDARQLINNTVYQTIGLANLKGFLELNSLNTDLSTAIPFRLLDFPNPIAPLPDGRATGLPEEQLKGKVYILVNEWGPYDFRYPICWLREVDEDRYSFQLMGPAGNWKVVGSRGFGEVSAQTGTFPATLTARREADAREMTLELEFVGSEVVNQFGRRFAEGAVVPFSFNRIEQR
jgi:parallel beta-helix repeat protein